MMAEGADFCVKHLASCDFLRGFSHVENEDPKTLMQRVIIVVVQVLSHIGLFASSWTVARQAPLSMGILQARILGCVAISLPRGSSQPRNRTRFSCIGRQILYH